MKECKSNSLEARYAALRASNGCLQMMCEARQQEIRALFEHLRACSGDLAERTANDCDFHGIDASKWWKAVKRARKFLKPYETPVENRKKAAK